MKVGKDRIAVVIGKNGETKKLIEDQLGVKVELNSKTGDCNIIPDEENDSFGPLNVYTAQKIINAISRGFNPDKAMKLMEDEYDIAIFNLLKILGKSERRLKRIKGRIIGRDGEIRKAIERYAESHVSVYGKTVSVIAKYEELLLAKKAIEMIINGMPHHTVLKFLEDSYTRRKKEEFRKIYSPDFD